MTASCGDDSWQYDNAEDFFADFQKAEFAYLVYEVPLYSQYWRCVLEYSLSQSRTSVSVDSEKRHQINTVMNVFHESLNLAKPIKIEQESLNQDTSVKVKEEKVVSVSPFNIFIGHGRSKAWEELRNHLQDKHDYKIVAFESGARAGHHVRDILGEMLGCSSLAFLVLTGEDETADQHMRARQNVIHETGLFQGKLGFTRAIVLLEEGVEEFSNITGIQHIPFAKGHIDGTFGEVLAVIKREFGRSALAGVPGSTILK